MIERLTREHRSFESKLEEVEYSVYKNNDNAYAAKIIRNMSVSCSRRRSTAYACYHAESKTGIF